MTLEQFITRWLGKKADFDGMYGGQLSVPVKLFSFLPSTFCLFKGFIRAKRDFLVGDFNLSLITFISRRLPHASNTSCVVRAKMPRISQISRVGTYTKITFSIIKGIAVDMVNVFSFRVSHNKPVHFFYAVARKSFLKIYEVITLFGNTPFTAKYLQSVKVIIVDKNRIDSVRFASYADLFHGRSLPCDRQLSIII